MARKDSYILGPKDTVITTQPLPANPFGPAIIVPHLGANLALVIGPAKIFGLVQAEQLQLIQVIAKESTNMPLGKKKSNDTCTRKVKARYSVWPSAYASGALVRCRKVGAKNWGNKGTK